MEGCGNLAKFRFQKKFFRNSLQILWGFFANSLRKSILLQKIVRSSSYGRFLRYIAKFVFWHVVFLCIQDAVLTRDAIPKLFVFVYDGMCFASSRTCSLNNHLYKWLVTIIASCPRCPITLLFLGAWTEF